ncbi:putative hydrolase of the HAD superfamily [Peteryoungia aggregata LMG 23059]|uniref:Hydrolase of the HAD superfamily n=1 Tax=Peteryoungia aggregata LMG 23059 TaxID=1368425 RepID=A0ABU0G2G0_9HYPH|nr:HAD family hydrolase [Peteryoungia aggregata]MDQ0419521.1 putative hydrolase of the HAD superfamily [Peteryoungia aggregata LMG 23059]
MSDCIPSLAALPPVPTDSPDHALAQRHRPKLLLDGNEPFAPVAIGYAVYREPAKSVSSKFRIRPGKGSVIEYAIWYDWDIQHLYDLEHVWVHLDDDGVVVRVEASRHGTRLPMRRSDGSLPVEEGRPVLFVEPGKHAHWADADAMRRQAGLLVDAMCGAFAGEEGIHLSNLFSDKGLITASRYEIRLARLHLKRRSFAPAWTFAPVSDAIQPVLLPWEVLGDWIPRRFASLTRRLPGTVPHLAAVLLDCGDTLVDESTEVKSPGTDVVLSGKLIPGADAMLQELATAGHRLALVADGPRATFENLLGQHGLWSSFEAHVISGDVGELKPSARMFAAAFEALGLSGDDRARTVMVGNNLERDILGANRFGLISVFLAWSLRRSHRPKNRRERPRLTIRQITQLPALLEKIELALPAAAVERGGDVE